MNINQLILICTAAYLAGSIPTAVWIGKALHGIDIREYGSKNAGATNTIRVLGWKTGIPVLIIDILKGWVAASIPVFIANPEIDPAITVNYQIFAGLIAIAGHVFPVFAGFRGGKGVATTFGFLLALTLPVTLVCLGIFLAVLLTTGYVSLSSMIAGISFPILVNSVPDTHSILLRCFSVIIAVGLIVTHQKNIVRLIRHEEKKLFRWKKKADD